MMSTLFGCLLVASSVSVQVSVDGDGYLRFVREGRVVYAKEATLAVVAGQIASVDGHPVTPGIPASSSPVRLEVDLEGRVSGVFEGSKRPLGRLVLATFSGVQPTRDRDGYLVATVRPTLANPGEGKAGVVRMAGIGTTVPPKQTPAKSTPSGTNRIAVRATSEVAGRQFTLGEIADVQGPDAETLAQIVVGESPALGVERGIDKVRIQSRLKMAGVNPTGIEIAVPANAKITRRGGRVGHEQFLAKAIEAAKELAPASEFKSTTNHGDMVVPEGAVELIAERTSQNGAQVSVTVAVVVDGKRFNSRTLQLVSVAGAGQVKAGAAVRIRVISNGAVVEVTGRTKAAANVGGTVEVLTNASAQMPSTALTGVLLEPGIVEVKL